MSATIRRFRGCFLGGPVHGNPLPDEIRAPKLLYREATEEGLVRHVYEHRRLDTVAEDGAIDSVAFLVHNSLGEERARELAAQEAERRGGWGAPALALPAAGFRYETEADWSRDLLTGEEHLGAFGLVKRFGPEGMAIASSLHDVSRAVAIEELDQARCEWCAHEIGHTIEIHRERLAADAAERRAAELPPRAIPEPSPLALAVIRGIQVDEDLAFCAEASEALALEEAHRLFLARRQAEAAANADAAPHIILPAGVRA